MTHVCCVKGSTVILFQKFSTLFSMKFDKPGRIELYIAENLKINNQGVLEIKNEIITTIENYKINLPLL